MNWASLAIFSTVIMGMVSIIDSHLLSKRMPGFRAYLLPVGIVYIIYGVILVSLFPFPPDIGWRLPGILASGVIRTTSVIIMLYSLQKEEVSRVIPVVYSYPIFVALMAVPLLGESLHYLQWLAIFIVVAGAIIISTRTMVGFSRVGTGFFMLAIAALLFALADLSTKYFLAYISSWNMFSITCLLMGLAFLLISARSSVTRQLSSMKGRNLALVILLVDELLAAAGILLSFRAMESGPVSLVSAILGSRPIFVVIYASIAGLVFPGSLVGWSGGRLFALRLVASVMIVGGIAIIYLT